MKTETMSSRLHQERLRRQFIMTANALGNSAGVRIAFGDSPSTNGSRIVLSTPPADWGEKEQNEFLGDLAHECGHIRFTTFARIGEAGSPFEHSIDNALEDTRIEREMGKLYRGAERLFRESQKDAVQSQIDAAAQIASQPLPVKIAALPHLIPTYLITLTEGKILMRPDCRVATDAIQPILEETLGSTVVESVAKIALEVEKATSTRGVMELRKRIIEELRKAIPQSSSSNSKSKQEQRSEGQQSESKQDQSEHSQSGESRSHNESESSSSSSQKDSGKKQKGKSGKSNKSQSSDKDENDAGKGEEKQDGQDGQNEPEDSDSGNESNDSSSGQKSEGKEDQDKGEGSGKDSEGGEESTKNEGSDKDANENGEESTENGADEDSEKGDSSADGNEGQSESGDKGNQADESGSEQSDGNEGGSESGNGGNGNGQAGSNGPESSESDSSASQSGSGAGGSGYSPGDILNDLSTKTEDECRSALDVDLQKRMPNPTLTCQEPDIDLTDTKPETRMDHGLGKQRLDTARTSASALMQALSGVIRGHARVGSYLSTSGRHIDAGRIARIACGNTRVFKHREEAKKEAAAVHILLDMSGSMGGAKEISAMNACLGMLQALEKFPEVSSGFSVFPARATSYFGSYETCVTIKGHNERLTNRDVVARIGGLSSNGGTPLRTALAHGRIRLMTCPNPKKVLFVITDGIVSASDWEPADQMKLEGYKVFAIFIGQPEAAVTQAKPHITDGLAITSILDLKRALFEFAKRSL